MLLECFPKLYKVEFYERKQNGTLINMDACPRDKLPSQAILAPSPHGVALQFQRGGSNKESKE